MTELLTVKELSISLKRSADFIYRMRAMGFPMPGGTATIEEARKWLLLHGCPRSMPNPAKSRQKERNRA